MDQDEVRALLKEEVRKLGKRNNFTYKGGLQAFADTHGVHQGYLSCVISGHSKPGPAIVAALGLKKVVTYEPIESKKSDGG